ncbi:4'-phosphopantetheinyl transferase family protein [Paenibacillus xylaniclasticus]|uniref:4'-phosphopantetheinyl transferase family protein n=1 Tax=Paenibacillus xylaniclasticus TaxID=588083 RepID=UPI000FDBED80|nr:MULTISPECIES: 4'-phosphopantetheinyl transferase superfamily protein [Paenibacillus]GFN29899.1 4'-phosphopantetheinyl transferase [Paenibacillus curdlanolyticus]
MLVELFMVRINEKISPSIIYQDVLPTLSAERQNRVRNYRREEDARRSIVAEMLIRAIVMDKFKLAHNEIVFGTNAYQKPFLTNNRAFHFNLSHSGDWVLCAIDASPVGTDVERIKPIDLDVARRFFSASEYIDLMSKPESEQLTYFYRLWTMKESYIKAVGKGLSIPLDSFTCQVSETGERALIEDSGRVYFLRTFPLGDYMVSVCTQKDQFSQPLELKEETLIHSYLSLLNRRKV